MAEQPQVDPIEQVRAVTRTVSERDVDGRRAKAVVLAQTFDTGLDDAWDAVTNVARIPNWFAPVSGDLRLGGRFQIEGNAGGTITACEPLRSFDATWEFGEALSWIEVRLAPEGAGRTRVELSHTAFPDEHWETYGPGATGVGWDLAFLGLRLYVDGAPRPASPDEWPTMPEGMRFTSESGAAWSEADIAGGEDPGRARAAAARTVAFYTGAEA